MKEKQVKQENPYRQGDSHELFDYVQSKQIVTKEECRQWLIKELGKSEKAACSSVTTVLSPRKKSRRGDCRGNMSSEGHLYYMEKLNRTVRYGIREPQRFRLRWREVPMERRWRKQPAEVKQEKVKVNVRVMRQRMKELESQIQSLKKEFAKV